MVSLLITLLLFLHLNGIEESPMLYRYNIQNKNVSSTELPKALKEISGMAVTKDGRVFAHNDERAVICQVDVNSGEIIKSFSVGKKALRGDFEDIAIVDKKFYLITSDGYLIEFTEGRDKSSVDYKRYETGLSASYNIEGMCYDDETNSLILACKDYPGNGYNGYRTCYSFSLASNKLDKKPKFVLPIKYITGKIGIKDFKPSGISKNPASGSFFIISANDNGIIEVSPDGKVIAQSKLPKHIHEQPEGIAFLPDKTLLISDEGKTVGSITKYPLGK
ncbi:MAG: hypothetical protein C4539_16870 [Ignavibacteriales bacterium]|nr:MAG: hypothetical protein C4539_16870 [Ignavibacteriales bacterium]